MQDAKARTHRKRGPKPKLLTAMQGKVLGLAAGGVSNRDIARIMGTSDFPIRQIVNAPEHATLIDSLRRRTREDVARGVQSNVTLVTDWIHSLLSSASPGTAREVDALSRALHALEKSSASAAGENLQRNVVGPAEIKVTFPQWVTPSPSMALATPAQAMPCQADTPVGAETPLPPRNEGVAAVGAHPSIQHPSVCEPDIIVDAEIVKEPEQLELFPAEGSQTCETSAT